MVRDVLYTQVKDTDWVTATSLEPLLCSEDVYIKLWSLKLYRKVALDRFSDTSLRWALWNTLELEPGAVLTEYIKELAELAKRLDRSVLEQREHLFSEAVDDLFEVKLSQKLDKSSEVAARQYAAPLQATVRAAVIHVYFEERRVFN